LTSATRSPCEANIKAKLRQIRHQRSRQRMMQNVPGATVIVTNPTHYSVALRYEPGEGDPAPICVAKGVDALALRIREVAREHNVPIVENVPLARALYAAVDIDDGAVDRWSNGVVSVVCTSTSITCISIIIGLLIIVFI
jgi:flagellar biosynthetic protein FlhB